MQQAQGACNQRRTMSVRFGRGCYIGEFTEIGRGLDAVCASGRACLTYVTLSDTVLGT